MAPVLGLHTRVVHLVLTERNPFSMALQISSRLPSSDENAMTDGPAPLMVNPFAPAAMTAFFIRSKPGIENFLAGSTDYICLPPAVWIMNVACMRTVSYQLRAKRICPCGGNR